MDQDHGPKVTITFHLPVSSKEGEGEGETVGVAEGQIAQEETRTKVITIENTIEANVNVAVSPESNTSYEYSGRHDHGQLLRMKSDGPIAVLVKSIEEAKRECDKYLTECINIEYGYSAEDSNSKGGGGEGGDIDDEMQGGKKKKIKK